MRLPHFSVKIFTFYFLDSIAQGYFCQIISYRISHFETVKGTNHPGQNGKSTSDLTKLLFKLVLRLIFPCETLTGKIKCKSAYY